MGSPAGAGSPAVDTVSKDAVTKQVRMRSADRREQIVAAAIRLVGEYGVRGTTMLRVAEAVGVTPMALYRHFPNKAALLGEASARLTARAVAWVHSSTQPSVIERLWEVGECHARVLSADILGYNAPMMQFMMLTPGDGGPIDVGANVYAQLTRILSDVIEEGKRQGDIRPDLDADVFAAEWIAWAQGEDVAYIVGARSGAFSREPFLRTLYLILADIAAPGRFEPPAA